MGDVDKKGLAAVRRVVAGAMRTRGARVLFNAPVDPEALGLSDYFDVVKRPMDLGTVFRALEEGRRSDWATCRYRRPADVLADVAQIWDNCYLYNSRESDAPTRAMCDEVRRAFERAWREAGLDARGAGGSGRQGGRGAGDQGGADAGGGERQRVAEGAIPEQYAVMSDALDLPLHILDDFTFSTQGDPSVVVPLDQLCHYSGKDTVVGTGSLLPNTVGPKGKKNGVCGGRLPVYLDNVLDWCIQYGSSPAMWVATKKAWYKLVSPSEDYKDVLASTMRKYLLCMKAVDAHTSAKPTSRQSSLSDDLESLVAQLMEDPSEGSPVADASGDASFVTDQLRAWLQASAEGDGVQPPASKRSRVYFNVSKSHSQKSLKSSASGAAHISVEGQSEEQLPNAAALVKPPSRKRPRSSLSDQHSKQAFSTPPCEPHSQARGASANVPGRTGRSPQGNIDIKGRTVHDEDQPVISHFTPHTGATTACAMKKGSEGAKVALNGEDGAGPLEGSQMLTRRSNRQHASRFKLRDNQGNPRQGEEHALSGMSAKTRPMQTPDYTLNSAKAPRSRPLSVRLRSLKKPSVPGTPPTTSGDGPPENAMPPCSPTTSAVSALSGDDEEDPSFNPSWESSISPSPIVTRKRTARGGQQGSDAAEQAEAGEGESMGGPRSSRRVRLVEGEGQRKRKKVRDVDGKVEREVVLEEARGPPPEPIRDFRVAPDLVGEVLMIWEMLMFFTNIFQIPPFPFWRMEAALCPLPDAASGWANKQPSKPDQEAGRVDSQQDSRLGLKIRLKCDAAQLDGVPTSQDPTHHVSHASSCSMPDPHDLKLKIKLSSDGGIASAARASGLSSTAKMVVDEATAASAVLLRDIHCAILKVIEGKGSVSTEVPRYAKLSENDNSQEHWTQRLSLCLLRAPLDEVDDETRAAAQFMQMHDYLDLDTGVRLKILKALVSMALATEVIREHVNGLVEVFWAQRNKTPKPESQEATHEEGGADTEGQSVLTSDKSYEESEKWMKWMASCKLGFQRMLGRDSLGRRYWVFGGRAGCWRVFVEERPHMGEPGAQSSWGYYEGASWNDLVAWLAKGEQPWDAQVLALLQSAPMPPQLPTPCPTPKNDTSPANTPAQETLENKQSSKLEEPRRAATAQELDLLRLDGYRTVIAPLLRGEGSNPEINYCSALEVRMLACLENIMACLPFWSQDGRWCSRLCNVMESAKAAKSAFDMAHSLAEAEQLLFEAGVLSPRWTNQLRGGWRFSLTSCKTLKDVSLHLVSLQHCLLPDPYSLHRMAFDTITAEARCPLYFPHPGSTVVFLRTGCQLHLQKFLGIAAAPTGQVADGPPGTASVSELSENEPRHEPRQQPQGDPALANALQIVSGLRPVERFRIACIAYRSPFPMEVPAGAAISPNSPPPPAIACQWVLLQPIKLRPGSEGQAVAVPIHVDNSLPDYIVNVSGYDLGMNKHWQAGDRFRMFFAGKWSSRGQAGVYYKGTVVSVAEHKADQPYDPWESLTVEWDADNSEGPLMKVSPWEIEVDPEDEKRREEDRRREEEVLVRAARAAAKQQRAEYLSQLGGLSDSGSVHDPDFDPDGEATGGRARRSRGNWVPTWQPPSGSAYDPSRPVGPIPPDVLQGLPDRDGFAIIIHNFMRRLKGKFKCPIFAGQELDLHKVFHEVQVRGGYDRVTKLKLWKDVCRTLNVDLRGQTSASYNMRLNYEKCLLDFEHYVASGEYTRELAEGVAPSAVKIESITAIPRPSGAPALDEMAVESGVRDPSQLATPTSAKIAAASTPPRGVSMTELLLGDDVMPAWGATPLMPVPDLATSAATPPSAVLNPAWLRMVAPPHSCPPSSIAPASSPPSPQPGAPGWLDNPASNPLVDHSTNKKAYSASMSMKPGHVPATCPVVEIQAGESIGMALNRMGQALVGAEVWRRWPAHGSWYRASVTGFKCETNEHCLVYEKDLHNRSVEWVDLRELESEELRQICPEPGPSQLEDLKGKRSTASSASVPMSMPSGLQQTVQPTVQAFQGLSDPVFLQQSLLHQSVGGLNLTSQPALVPSVMGSLASARMLGAANFASAGNAQQGVNPMEIISQVLKAGIAPDALKRLVDDAASNLGPANPVQAKILQESAQLAAQPSCGRLPAHSAVAPVSSSSKPSGAPAVYSQMLLHRDPDHGVPGGASTPTLLAWGTAPSSLAQMQAAGQSNTGSVVNKQLGPLVGRTQVLNAAPNSQVAGNVVKGQDKQGYKDIVKNKTPGSLTSLLMTDPPTQTPVEYSNHRDVPMSGGELPPQVSATMREPVLGTSAAGMAESLPPCSGPLGEHLKSLEDPDMPSTGGVHKVVHSVRPEPTLGSDPAGSHFELCLGSVDLLGKAQKIKICLKPGVEGANMEGDTHCLTQSGRSDCATERKLQESALQPGSELLNEVSSGKGEIGAVAAESAPCLDGKTNLICSQQPSRSVCPTSGGTNGVCVEGGQDDTDSVHCVQIVTPSTTALQSPLSLEVGEDQGKDVGAPGH